MEKAREAFRTISEVAEDLDIPQHVLRFWESRFAQIKPMKRGGGRRYYRPEDVALLCGIRHLLYGQGYTIRGVQRILRERGIRYVQAVWEAQAEQPGPVDEHAGAAEGAEDAEEAAADDRALGRLHSSRPEIGREPPLPRNERREPTFAPTPQAAAQARPTGAEAPDRRQALRSALAELAECRRVLDAALDDVV